MTDIRSMMTQNYETMQQEVAKLFATYHPANVTPPYSDGGVTGGVGPQQSEADVRAAENEPGLGDGSADPVRQAEQSPGLYAASPASLPHAPAPIPPVSPPAASPADAARIAMDTALRATRASLVQNVTLIDQSLAAADLAVRQALAATGTRPSGSTWPS